MEPKMDLRLSRAEMRLGQAQLEADREQLSSIWGKLKATTEVIKRAEQACAESRALLERVGE